MKYLAILKDSVREALDNKLIYVLVGLSLLLGLFGLSAGFEPLPPAEMMGRLLQGDVMRPGDFEGGGPRQRKEGGTLSAPPQDRGGSHEVGAFQVDRVEPSQSGSVGPDSPLSYKIALPLKTKEEADRVRADPGKQMGRLRSRLALAEQLHYFRLEAITLANDPAGDKATVFFVVRTEPTPDSRLVWSHEYSLLWGAVPLGGGAPLWLVLTASTTGLLWIGSLVTILLSVIVTAFFIPNMLRKGTIDLLLCRPISRPALLVYKYVGGLTFIFLNTAVAIASLWLVLGLRAGVWANAFLLMIFVYTFFFAILYAASTLFAVWTRSAVVAILLTCGVWFVLFAVGTIHRVGEQQRREEGFFQVMRTIHFVLPRTADLDSLGNQALVHDFIPQALRESSPAMQREPFDWTESITVSLAFIVVVLGVSCWLFARKDY